MTKMLLVFVYDRSRYRWRSPDMGSRGNAIGGGHKFVRCYQKLFNCSKGRVHVLHPSLSCGHQMGLC